MSLTIALRTALTSLQVTQSQLQVASNNIANVNTVGYTRKDQQASSVLLDSRGAGVRAGTIQRSVDALLQRQVRDQYSTSGQWDVRNQFLQTIQGFFGNVGDNSSVAHDVTALGTSFSDYTVQPESPSRASDVVSRAQLLAQQVNSLSSNLQLQRAQVDHELASIVTDINNRLDQIASLNAKITHARSLSQSTADLEDERDRLVKDIGQELDVRTFERPNGEMAVLTSSGRRLIDGSDIQYMSHDASASLGANATYIPPSATGMYGSGGVAGIHVGTPDTVTGASDITTEIADGRMKALIDMRDKILAGNQSSLDELAAKLRDALNAEHNNGAAWPPPATLTGTYNMAATDPFSATGTVRIALVDRTTGAVGNVADIALGGLTTVAQVMNAINTAPGLGGNVTASIVGGKLTLATGNGTGIVINENDSAVAVGAGTRGLSQFFGLNDMFVAGINYAAHDSNVQTGATTALGLTGPLTFSFGASTVNIAVAATDDLTDIAGAINADATLTAAGIAAALVTDASGVRLRVTDAGGDNFFLSSAGTAVSGLGLTAQRVGAAAVLAVRPTLAANPSLLSRGDVSMTAVVGDIEMGSGDASVARRLADAFTAGLSWPSSGNGIPSFSDTFAAYATQILSRNADLAAEAEDQAAFSRSLYQQLDTTLQAGSGVNLDEELANLTVLQNAYAAAARVVNVASELFEQLANLIR